MTIHPKVRAWLLLACASLSAFLILELGARCYLSAITGFDPAAIIYGWTDKHLMLNTLVSGSFSNSNTALDQNPSVVVNDWDPAGHSLENVPLTDFEINCGGAVHFNLYGHQILAHELLRSDTLKSLLAEPTFKDKRITAWAFGGSTTAGYNFDKKASSWPEELERLIPSQLQITNFGENGFSSDQSIDKIRQLLKKQPAPDVVFWANWANESDVLYFVMDRNYEKLSQKFSELRDSQLMERIWQRNAHQYFFRSLILSLDRRIVLFRLLRESLQHFNPKNITDHDISSLSELFDDRGVAVTVENYQINLEELIDLSRQHSFQIIIVRLPIRWRGMLWENGKLNDRWLWANPFNEQIDELAQHHNIPIIDLQGQMLRAGYFSTP